MPILQGTRLAKLRNPLLPQPSPPSGAPLQATERRSRLLTRSNEFWRRKFASTHSNSNQEQESELLQAVLEEVASAESSLKQEIESLTTALAQATANEESIKRENVKHRRRLDRVAATTREIRRECES